MITVVGSLNMDLIIRVREFARPGETIYGSDFQTACGGKGANQAYAIAKLGGQVNMVGCTGDDDFGKAMLVNLNAVGVDTRHVLLRVGQPSGVALITVDSSGQNEIVVAAGANQSLTADDVAQVAHTLRQSQAVVTQLETTLPAMAATLSLARAAGVLTVLNPAPFSPIGDDVLGLCDYIIPNEHEASQLTGLAVHDLPSAQAAASALKARGAKNVMVTLGAQGVWVDAIDAGMQAHVPAFPVQAIDTVAAGDTFVGGFVTRLCEGADVREATRFGCAAAAIAVTRKGAQPSVPSRAEVERILSGLMADG
jgi:ribokinase